MSVPPATTLPDFRRAIAARFDVATETLDIDGERFTILRVRDTNALLDRVDPAAFARDERLPYWAELWPSSIALASRCLRESSLRDRQVLEVGCGLGLAGIAAARAGAAVTLTDYEPDALLFAHYNTMANGEEESCAPVLLDWRSPECNVTYDVILGADVMYETRAHLPLLELIGRCLRPDGRAVFTDPARRHAGEFAGMANRRGFDVEKEETVIARNGQTVTVHCYTLRRRSVPAGEDTACM